MIDSFTISDEKFVNNEYFAKLETSFNKKKILDKLEEQKNKLEEERINYERLLRLKAAEARALNF